MANPVHEHPLNLADVDFTGLKRIAAAERGKALRQAVQAVVFWLKSGIELRYSDDAVTHPAAGKPCGC